ncbi:hypothetical protein PHLGIDRAFT_375736 [Phlebiopsis gigantea 11061_1 CR5-6]|uniref:Uncharacterized protein n=1 Tax=Phlebiopsis gigantea (strain 11061_1 CR5-6) TaxID=745531 RepID=A0A0C3S0R1_PHLG1|nr:hypothetical protein PHLGIDRAFT_375736 [Phlebiopsis gigantea 11061_1 CR5-6]
MLSVPPHIHPTSHHSIFEPDIDVHNIAFKMYRSPEDVPPSCVYICVEKSQKPAPPQGHKWILFWHINQGGEDCRRVIEASWTAGGRGAVVRTNKKRSELPANLATFCVGHLDNRELARLDKLTANVVPTARSNEWAIRVVRAAVREGLLEEVSVEEGVMGALAVNW